MNLRPSRHLPASAAYLPALATTRIVSPAPRDVWQRTLAADPYACPTQTPQWLDWLCTTRGYLDASRLYELPDGRTLILPMAAKTCAGVRITEESMPYGFGYGGALVAGGRLTASDADIVLADLTRRPVVRLVVVPMPLTGDIWAAAAPPTAQRVPYLTQIVDLDGGSNTVWSKRYSRDARNGVRRAEKNSLEIRRNHDASAVEAFAELNRQSVDRWAQQRGQPLWVARLVEGRRNRTRQLATASAALGQACVSWSAHRAGDPVAVHVTLHYGEQSILWMSVMNRDLANETYAGYLLQWLAIQDACNAGARYFHMGESEAGSGVEQFKAKFGASPVQYEALRFERLPLTDTERRLRAMAKRMTDRRRPEA
ncbi:MAG: GNAT family N-acetyltransferase [Pseudonocardiales bacterium]|nr:GNAT family N-acetyltransferase [Pseudonocardiales bacterium]